MLEGSHSNTLTLAPTPPTSGSPDNDSHTADEDEGDIDGEITEGMRRLSVNSQPFRYHGRSSTMVFIRSTIALKSECTASIPAQQGDRQHPVSPNSPRPDTPSANHRPSGCKPWLKITSQCLTRAASRLTIWRED